MPDLAQTPSQFNVIHNPYVDDFTSVSGSDIVGVFGHVEFLNLQGVSVSVNREIQPIYVMGRVDPTSFVRGKRGVAGSLVTVCNDRGALHDIMEQFSLYAASTGEYNKIPGQNSQAFAGNALDPANIGRLGFQLRPAHYADQIPPYDVTLVGRADNIAATISRIGGVFNVSMGTGMSIDDNSIEQQFTFVALYYEDWKPAGRKNRPTSGQQPQDINVLAPGAQGREVLSTRRAADALRGEFFNYGDL